VCVESSKNPPECLFVLNPRLFGISVKIEDHSFIALLDSGATKNFISKRVVDSLRCPLLNLKTPTLVKVATGAEQRVDKFVNLYISLVSICIPMSFRVIDMEPELIFYFRNSIPSPVRSGHQLEAEDPSILPQVTPCAIAVEFQLLSFFG